MVLKKAVVNFDGSARPNPGRMKIGAIIRMNGKEERISKEMGWGTNNMAEYLALIEALKKALEMGAEEVEIYGDSTLVIEQLRGNYRVRDEKMKKLYAEVIKLLSKFQNWTANWIPEELNKTAHDLSQ